jgi:hypothetical protein
MKVKSIPEKLIFVGVVFFPFQNLALAVAGSLYDVSCFIILLAAIVATFINQSICRRTLIWFCIFITIQIIIFTIINVAPFYRLISGLVWFGGLILLYLSRTNIDYRRDVVFKLIIASLFISAIYCIYSITNNGMFSRPSAWFSEPSYAGLSFYSAAAGLIGILLLLEIKNGLKILFVSFASLFFLAALATLSMHIVSFLIAIFVIITMRISLKFMPYSLIIVSFFSYLSFLLFGVEHFSSRLNFGDNITNLSMLSWLRGLDQMLHVAGASPLFGFGLGSTGYFDFESAHSVTLANLGMEILNLTDAYSAFFRIIIELGIPFMIMLLIYICNRILVFKKYLKIHNIYKFNQSIPVVFLFIFSLTLTIGILIKEPTYSRSYVYVACLLLGTSIPMKKEKNQKYV